MARRKRDDPCDRMKLLVGIVGREDAGRFTATVADFCAPLSCSGLGFGTAGSNYLRYFGISEIEKRVVFSLIPAAAEGAILSALDRRLKLYLLGRGIAFVLPLSGISSLIHNALTDSVTASVPTAEKRAKAARKEKNAMHELVVAVVHQKYTDTVIDAARAAGATGATVLHTRSLGNEKAEQRIGTALPMETDTVAFLTSSEFKGRIMEAIRDAAGLKTEGGAVILSLAVDALVGIGKPEEDGDDGE